MKQFLINLFRIEQHFYISSMGFKEDDIVIYIDTWAKSSGSFNIQSAKEIIIKESGLTGLHIVNIMPISKKQYNQLNNGN